FLCGREAVRRMSTRRGGGGGSLVNVSSRAAVLGSPGEYVDYAAAKAAVDTFTLGLAQEVATEGIRGNAVRPGIIHTEPPARPPKAPQGPHPDAPGGAGRGGPRRDPVAALRGGVLRHRCVARRRRW